MVIEISAGGFSSVSQLQNSLNTLYNDISETITSLQSVNNTMCNDLNGGLGRLSTASTLLQNRIHAEEKKKESVQQISTKADTFLSNAISIDKTVASSLANSQEAFYGEYSWLRPKNVWEKFSFWLVDTITDFVNNPIVSAFLHNPIVEGVLNVINAIDEFLEEHLVLEVVLGTIFVVAAVALTILSGGTLGPIFIGIISCVLVSGTISAAFATVEGNDPVEGFGKGAAKGYFWSGLSALSSSTISTIKYCKEGGILNWDNFKHPFNTDRLYSHQSLNKLKNIDKPIGPNGLTIGQDGIKHEFEGGVRPDGTVGGYHVPNVEGTAGKIIREHSNGARGAIVDADVEINGIQKVIYGGNYNTMFPRSWSPQHVVDKINEALMQRCKNALKKGRHDLLTNGPDVSVISDGIFSKIKIKTFIRNGKFISAYPVH